MVNKKLRKVVCVMATSFCLVGASIPVFASSIAFDVTVGGTGSQDPFSYKEIKTKDGDQYAYFRATYVSNTKNAIRVRSYNSRDTSIRSTSYATLSNANLGKTLSRKYNKHAPGGENYHMKAEATNNRIKVKGYYCP